MISRRCTFFFPFQVDVPTSIFNQLSYSSTRKEKLGSGKMRGPGDEVGWLKGSKECSKSIVKCCEEKSIIFKLRVFFLSFFSVGTRFLVNTHMSQTNLGISFCISEKSRRDCIIYKIEWCYENLLTLLLLPVTWHTSRRFENYVNASFELVISRNLSLEENIISLISGALTSNEDIPRYDSFIHASMQIRGITLS